MINIIGIGPNRENITISALKALEESDVIIGYKKYIDSISDLIEGKEVIRKGMGDEIARGELAIAKSLEGKEVAIISSGDPGVYGMANLMFQLISKYKGIDVKVFPGVSAVNFAADILGAPLHDFAVISLSDILTPLCEIEKKIEYAAKADFIIAIYNPISKTRKEPFKRFKEILKETKDSKTLIGIVNSKEDPNNPKKLIITLEDFENIDENDENYINMSTTLIVGNSLTYLDVDSNGNSYLITPRGYVIKSDIHPLSEEFYTKFLKGETPSGPNKKCEYYPCHNDCQCCDFCYCPFYPCGDSSTGGKWIKDKNVWSCQDCMWIHNEKTIQCIKEKLSDILEKPEDLILKKKQLLKLRRACILETKNNTT